MSVMVWGIFAAVIVAACVTAWRIAPRIDALDWVTRPKETHYERFQRLSKKYQTPGFVYATTSTTGDFFGLVAEDLDGKLVYDDAYVCRSDSPFMAEHIKRFMSSVNARKSRNGKDYI